MSKSNLAELVVQMRAAGFTAAEMLQVITAETTSPKTVPVPAATAPVKARVKEVKVSQAQRVMDMFFTPAQKAECRRLQNDKWAETMADARELPWKERKALARKRAAMEGNWYAAAKGLPLPYVKVQ